VTSSSVLDVSPLAALLLGLAARKVSGRLAFGDRTLVLRSGDVLEILPAADDDSLEHFLVESGRMSAAALAQYEQAAKEARGAVAEVLVARGAVNAGDLRQARRALLLDRLTRALRVAGERSDPLPAVAESHAPVAGGATVTLLPFLLDALARSAATHDAAVVGAHLNHRVEWDDGPHTQTARAWADLGDVPQRPAVSTVLAKRPAAAPRIAALLRAGLIRLDAPGRTVPSSPPVAASLPPPPPRAITLDGPAPRRASDPLAAVKPPRLRLDPGQVQVSAEPLAPTTLPELPSAGDAPSDPLVPLEQRIAELEAQGASGSERARAFCALADVWRDRFASLERACRAFREAAAADPGLPGVLHQAAIHCHHVGQHELALRYVEAAVTAAAIPFERAGAQRLRAAIARSAGDTDTCVEALCEAAADDPTTPDSHEQVSALLLERGQLDGANAHARLAATAIQEDAPDRALALLAFAWWLEPRDAPTAYEYASMLDAASRRAAAVAVLAHTGSRIDALDARRKLRLAAAERAEAAGRADIAAELLVDAFDAEPHFDLLYGPLDEDLAAVELGEYRAAVLEDVATACPDEQRAYWLTRAAHVLLQAQGQHEAAVWLLFEALLTEPHELARLTTLRDHAASRRELILLAHGMRAAIAARIEDGRPSADVAEARRLLRELAELAHTRLDNPHLALAAWQQRKRLGEHDAAAEAAMTALAAAIDARRAELDRAEQALASASGLERARQCRRVASLLPDIPEHWPRTIQLLSEALSAGDDDLAAARDTLETLYGLSRDAIALATFLEEQAELCPDRDERIRLLTRLTAVHTVREDTFAVAAVCESLIALDPGSRIAIARLERAARRLGDTRRLTRALLLRCTVARSARERARALAQLARAEELAGMASEAAAHAADALREDATAADAALLLLRHIDRVEPEVAGFGLRVAATVCGPSRALLSAQAQAAHALQDRTGERAALQAWVALLPNDASAHRACMRMEAATGDAAGLLQAAETALYAIPNAEILEAAREALATLERLGASAEAAELALRIAEEQGRPDATLAERALAAARAQSGHRLTARALELRVAVADAGERCDALFALADHHREHGQAAGEIRALLRVLELAPADPSALQRLRELFVAAGDATRLASVLNLSLEGERDPARRRELRLQLCAIAAGPLQDRERAELHVRALVAENVEAPEHVREALGVMVTLGGPSWALERCQVIAESCPPELGTRIFQWCAATAEQRLRDPRLAFEIARRGALRWPAYAELLLMVERLTLSADDTHGAMAVYDALIAAAIGPHARRALVYRAGRWLERAGLLEPALARYIDAFGLAPSMGAAFKATLRVARQTGQPERLLPCYEQLAEQSRDGRTRGALLRTAGELCVRELEDRARGLALLMRANATSERYELDDRLLEVARDLSMSDEVAGRLAMQQLAIELQERASQLWNAEDKVRCLLRLALVRSEGLREHAAALADLDEAERALEGEEPSPGSRVDIAAARDVIRARMTPSARPVPAELEPLAATPGQPLCDSDLDRVNAADVPAELLGDVLADVFADEAVASAVPVETAATPALPSTPPAVPAETPGDARARLHRLLYAEPWRTDALRELHALAPVPGDAAERHVVRQLLSVFDPGVSAAHDRAFHPGLWRGQALRASIGEDPAPELSRLLAMLWECARVIPRFRHPLATYGVSERDRISRITIGPVAEAYAQAARMLGATDVPVYLLLSGRAPARTLASHPPAVLASRGVADDPSALLYAMAHALWLAQPERMIGGVLPQSEAVELIEAARLAFAPALSRHANAGSKELAAALWQSVPTREQRAMADSLRRNDKALEYDALRARVRSSAARAALLASGGLRFALSFLVTTEPELTGVDLSSEAQFASGCQGSPALAETVRCALSEPFLTTLGQV